LIFSYFFESYHYIFVMMRIIVLTLSLFLLIGCKSEKDWADYYFEKKDYDKAAEYYKTAIKFYRNDWRALHNYGRSLQELERFQESIKWFNASLELNPYNVEGYVARSMSYLGLDRDDLALVDLDNALRRDPDHFEARYLRGKTYLRSGGYWEAHEDLTRVIELRPDYHMPYYYRSIARAQVRFFAGALKDIDFFIEGKPKVNDAHLKKGIILQRMGRYDQALQSYFKARDLGLRSAELYFREAVCFQQLGLTSQACNRWKDAEKLQPGSSRVFLKKYCG
jgi:tetratricopeptide (TPR) repeat protein